MPKFLATTQRGLGKSLEQELRNLNLKVLSSYDTGVYFEGNWADCYKANLCLRSASRVLYSILDFPAYNKDELYDNLQKHDFTKYISPNGTLYIEAKASDSKNFSDQRFVAMRTKDAIVDQFYAKFDERPDVDSKDPDLSVFVKMNKNQVNVSIDTSGEALFQRGYRIERVDASLKETLAAGLLQLSGWNKEIAILDPMCGSGSFLTEAALMALNVAPGTLRKSFAFQGLHNFQPEAWDEVLEEAMSQEKQELNFKFYGSDIDGKAVKIARANAKSAGVDEYIEFERKEILDLQPPCEKGIIIVNPPYGDRLGDEHMLKDVYRDFGHVLKERFKGWQMWMLSGNPELPQHLKMKATQRIPIMNGNIECRFLHYDIR